LHRLAFTLKVLLEKRREYNLETHFLCLDCEKAFKEVRPLLLSISPCRKYHNPLLTVVTNIYENNKKIKLDTTLTQRTKINKEARQCCPLSLTLTHTVRQLSFRTDCAERILHAPSGGHPQKHVGASLDTFCA
jgi:hypothetical protein